jgi:hypothetical protein
LNSGLIYTHIDFVGFDLAPVKVLDRRPQMTLERIGYDCKEQIYQSIVPYPRQNGLFVA